MTQCECDEKYTKNFNGFTLQKQDTDYFGEIELTMVISNVIIKANQTTEG